MRITPRADEVKAVVAIMESDEYESADLMAKAIIKQVAESFAERTFYAWVYRESPDAFYLPFGPFTSDNEAKKFAGKYVDMLAGQHMILSLHSTKELTDRMATHVIPTHHCQSCNHQLISHEHPKIQPKCAVRGCKCRKATS
jgi:hypothetical protein